MPLTLITGPANAAKAGAVFERLRAQLAREPVLVVPTSADAAHYTRELAAAGVVFGAEVTTFARLMRDVARLVGVRARPLGQLARERVVRAVVAEAELSSLAESARAPRFAGALGELFAELQRSLVGPARLGAAVRAWRASGEAPPYAGELAALYSAYRRRLEALGSLDADGLAQAALDELRAGGGRVWSRPLSWYGFDDLTPAQLDAVETLRRVVDVCVALPYEPGRAALAGSAATVELLKPLASELVVLEARSEHYDERARRALHQLERGLFEDGDVARVPPNGAVRLLEAGGERAEAELVGASILELRRDGMRFEDVAVLVRGRAAAEPIAQVLEGYGIPLARERRTPLRATRLGAGVLAFARAALPGGTAGDVLTWLRTPGKLAGGVDRLEADVLRRQARSAGEARRLWERAGGAPLVELDALAATLAPPAGEDVAAFLAALLAEADAIWTAPHARRGAVLSAAAEADARAAAELRFAVAELTRLAAADAALAGDPLELVATLGEAEVREAAAEGAAGVLLADPLAIRARRFRAVFVCALQDGELPRRPQPEPFLDDDARASLARASGLVLPRHEDALARERSLFYAAVSRPEQALFLSFRSSDEDGDPLQPSPFVDDVRALFGEELWSGRGRRLLADVTWPPAEAPTPHELRRAQAALRDGAAPPALAAPVSARVLADLAARDRESARGIESFALCGVRWLIEQVLRPAPVDPDPEPVRRGSLVHAVLERTLADLRERTGSARIAPATLPAALDSLARAIAELRRSGGGAAARAAARALEVDLERYLRHEAATGAGYEPVWLEWGFGGDRDAAAALDLDGVAISGRVDRIDVAPSALARAANAAAGSQAPASPLAAESRCRAGVAPADPTALRGGRAVVRDYKGKTVSAGARWAQDGRLQAALYALAVRERLGLDVVGALYQPIGRTDQRPRGLVRDDVPGGYVNGDVVEADELDAGLDAAREVALRAAADLRAGRIRPCPQRCGYDGSCAYPGICRS